MIPEQQTEQFSYMVPENYRKRNVWFLEMGAKESKTKSSPKTSTRTDCGSGTRTITSSQSVPRQLVQSAKAIPVWPDNSVRWLRKYDVYICHSGEEPDCSYAVDMLSYLEQQPEKLRCFLPMRDMLAGGAITSEMCSGLESSHCWVMLLTPHFLSDSWCKYQMHQFLAQAPCSNGRLIPVMIGLSFAQYPPEVKHMYAFTGAFNDNSVFIKIKAAILMFLKEMITVTSDKIPAHTPPSSRTPERSQSTSNPVGNSQEESSVTRESTRDTSSRISMTQEVTSDVSMGSSVTQEITSDMSMRSAVTQEVTTSGMSSRTQMTQETTSDMSMRSSVTQETTRDMSMGSSLIQEFTTDVSSRTSMTEETASDVSSSCSVTKKTTSDMSIRNSLTQKITSDMSMTSSLTQETTRDMSIESSLRNSRTQEANSNKSLRIPVTQEATSEIRLRSLLSEKPSSGTSTRSSFTRQETTHDVSMSSSETSCLSLSLPNMKNIDVCTDYKCTMAVTKDSFSGETPIDTGDSEMLLRRRGLLIVSKFPCKPQSWRI
ncbi:toll/interleukin-1 receptor domain-containing adapter protein isoform X2 [Bufo gargarizans]|uniref:toll/interleukin-1 receptor domain-containing adapter protein isoform X2 n=1 Tax=Bufo gargarizans TaxID=30331 RepID=UPI001CF585E8|nr:toll/interleukin-1 receptor domain-containing adapter protein isoform X2 [Bufo gargarizans]